jgi:cytoskeleton protein RodZ
LDQKTGNKIKILGRRLKETIEEKNVSVDEISNATKIRKVLIEAILDGDVDKLPSNIFIIGYLKAILDYLKVDSHSFIEEFKSLSSLDEIEPKGKEEYDYIKVGKGKKHLTISIVFAVLVLACSALYLFRFKDDETKFDSLSKFFREKFSKMNYEKKIVGEEIKEEPIVNKIETPGEPVVAEQKEAIPQNGIFITFSSDCWIEVYDKSKKVLVKNQYKKGDSISFSGDYFYLVMGDSSAVNIFLDGKEFPIEKEQGKVLKVTVSKGEINEPPNS